MLEAIEKHKDIFSERFEREIAASSHLGQKNPFILRAVDRIETFVDGEPLVGFVTEFVEGPDLKQVFLTHILALGD